MKNLLVFVPALTTQVFFDAENIWRLIVAFAVFSLASSSVYIVNDFVDKPNDQLHATKKLRPLASGRVNSLLALITAGSLIVATLVASTYLGLAFLFVVGVYLATSTIYTLYFKRIVVADVVVLSLLYVLRVLAGGQAIDTEVSFWLIGFSFFLFLSLGLLKRTSELKDLTNHQGIRKGKEAPGRGYSLFDLVTVSQLGISSAMTSVMLFSLYLDSESVSGVFEEPRTLWFSVPLLVFWFARLWILAGRGELDQDPVLFAVKDLASITIGLVLIFMFLLPQLGFAWWPLEPFLKSL